MLRFFASALPLCAAFAMTACASVTQDPMAHTPADALPAMRWQDTPQTERWTEATLAALKDVGEPLLSEVPRDIDEWCPGYPDANADQRAAFWAGMLSTLAKHESTWNPRAAGGGGAWIGLVQIAPPTARGYGCEATTVEALKDGASNLKCAVRIAAVTVPRDGYVGTGSQGLAADWGPFHSSRKRSDMMNWTRQQSYCQAAG